MSKGGSRDWRALALARWRGGAAVGAEERQCSGRASAYGVCCAERRPEARGQRLGLPLGKDDPAGYTITARGERSCSPVSAGQVAGWDLNAASVA